MRFGNVIALDDVSLKVHAGEVMCLLGDNGAGKSTLIKILSGVYRPTMGKIRIKGKEIHLQSPSDAMDKGIGTVFQDLALLPMMSITRNFFMGRELNIKGKGPFKRVDWGFANAVVKEELHKMGIDIQDPSQAVGTLSRGRQQCVAIARAVYFGARVLLLDEPTSALGIERIAVVLRYVKWAKSRGIAVIFITHNVYHAYAVGDTFTVLNRGRSCGTFKKEEVDRVTVLGMMAGGQEMEALGIELEELVQMNTGRSAGDELLECEVASEKALAAALLDEAHKLLIRREHLFRKSP